MSCQRVVGNSSDPVMEWIGPNQAADLTPEQVDAYSLAHQIQCHMAVRMPREHSSGHPGGPLSAFTPMYWLYKRRDPSVDQPLRMSPGHLSVLSYTLQWLFGREGDNPHLASPHALIQNFRIPSGLPGHVEAGIGDIPFGTGPLGKGVSNALGVAFGLKHQGKPGIVDVLMADGDAQEGQIFEAFRLAAQLKADNLVVHGDWNDIQLSGLPTQTMAADFARMAAAAGWHVIEVQNGNDSGQVVAALDRADALVGEGKPIFICYYTTMGYGIDLMEQGSNSGEKNYHGAPLSDEEAETALAQLDDLDDLIERYEAHRAPIKKAYDALVKVETDISLDWDTKKLTSYERTITAEKGAARKDFGATHLLNLMKADDRIVVLHADLAGSGGFNTVEKEFPDRCINVGVAEANMYMMTAGMRQTGLLPVTYTFAAFGTNEARASARLIDINCSHTRCGVLHDCTHAGLSVGEDGETHQERHYLDIPFDNTQVWMPGDSNQAAAAAEKAMEIIAEGHQSVYTFFPRSGHPQLLTPGGDVLYGSDYTFDGKADLVRGAGDTGDQATIIASGIILHEAVKAADMLLAENVQVRVLNVASIRPFDAAAIIEAALETTHLIVAEDHSSATGLAAQVASVIADFSLPCSLRRLGVNQYFPSGKAADLHLIAGLDADNIADSVQDELHSEVRGGVDALVSTIYEMPARMSTSQHGAQIQSFVDRLIREQGYLKQLRSYWEKRVCTTEDLPADDDLLSRLTEEGYSPSK